MKKSPIYHFHRKQAKAQRRRKRQAIPARRVAKRAMLQQQHAQGIARQKQAVGLLTSDALLRLLVGRALATKKAA